MDSLDLTFTVIALSETWFNDCTVGHYTLQGYNYVNMYRNERSGGGVSLFIKEDYQYIRRPDLSVFNSNLESLFVEITMGHKNNFEQYIIIGVIYQPPNTDVLEFNNVVSDILDKLKPENKSVYISGDYNKPPKCR